MKNHCFASSRFLAVFFILTVFFTLFPFAILENGTRAFAQDAGQKLAVEGIVGDVDKGRRAPVITFSTSVAADGSSATILVDTQIINEEYRRFPIAVDFYVNGKLFSKQYRSLELPNPLGINVPNELAPIPFNYAIVATLLHTNRQFVSIVQGSISAPGSGGSLNCTATEQVGGDAVGVDVSGAVDTQIGSDNKFVFTLTDADRSAEVSLTVEPSSSTTARPATGTVTVKQGSNGAVTYDVSGTVTAAGTTVSAVDASEAGGKLSLSCNTVAAAAASTIDSSLTSSDGDASGLSELEDLSSDGGDSGSGGGSNFVPLDKIDEIGEPVE